MDYNRVFVTENIHHTDGRLLVEKGAVGRIVSQHQGFVGVLFDEGSAYVELTGCGQRLQDVPFISTRNTDE